jgi:hypothetical protein
MKTLSAFFLAALSGAFASPTLWERGYSVIPEPRSADISDSDVAVGPTWALDAGAAGAQHIATRTLVRDLREFHQLSLGGGKAGVISLAVRAGAVKTGAEAGIDRQAYRLTIAPQRIEIVGNDNPGLLYGVNTLVQLVKRDSAGRLLVPEGVIEDWPQYQLRFLHWDTKHHQDRIETLKRYLDWSARMKVNMIGFEIEDKFEYPSHPVIGAPGAFTTAQLQEIVNYGLERFIQVVPQVQSPAHLAYVLKHPEFADLRADGNNYQSAMCDPRTYDLIFSMYDDAIKATRGVDYFFVSTDEVYYAGIDKGCSKPYTPENRSLQWVDFVQKAEQFLSKRGRKMLIWAEYPLMPQHAKLLPKGIIDGVVGNDGYLAAEKQLGIRQLSYNSMQGGEYLFPSHLAMETENGITRGHLRDAQRNIQTGRHTRGNPIGVFGAAWDDNGLHNETFWMGWSAVAQYGWNPKGATPEQHAAAFLRLYYGPQQHGLAEVYRAMQRQGRAWERSWDRAVSKARGPGYGNSYGKGRGTERHDMTLTPPPLPALPDLTLAGSFTKQYARTLETARERAIEDDRLILAIEDNFPRVERNRYNLEVFLSIARFTAHHWNVLLGLADAERSLERARGAHGDKRYAQAVGNMVAAFQRVEGLNRERQSIFRDLTAVWEKSRYPKGQTVGGRKFVHVLDDTKDHWADRRADLSYMTAPEENIGLDGWAKQLSTVIRSYAKEHNVPVRGLEEERLEQ